MGLVSPLVTGVDIAELLNPEQGWQRADLLGCRVDDDEDAVRDGGPDNDREESYSEGVEHGKAGFFPFEVVLEKADVCPCSRGKVGGVVQVESVFAGGNGIELLAAWR